jgi:hypothetical protein
VSTGGVRETAHLEKTDLIKTSSEDIDNVAVLRNALGEGFVELLHVSFELLSFLISPTFSAFL